MTIRRRRVVTRPIRVIQINTNRSTNIMNTIHAEHIHKTDLILYQEPGFAPNPAPAFLPPNALGLTPILPIPIEQLRTQERCPRVMAYTRPSSDFTVTPRYDICEDHDMMVIEIRQTRKTPFFIINLYNPGRGTPGAHSTGERLMRLNLPVNGEVIIAGDFNLHHPDWEEMETEPIEAARNLAEWLQGNRYLTHNAHNVPTYLNHDGRFQSVVDLTCSNQGAVRARLLQGWRIDPSMRELSDHVGIRFEVGHGHEITDTFTNGKWNWKKADRKLFCDTFKTALIANSAPIEQLKNEQVPTVEQMRRPQKPCIRP